MKPYPSPGTLGVITGCSLALPPLPSSVRLAFLGLASYAQVTLTLTLTLTLT